jgi:uncharacterized protein YndB with AHSA1/START domain
LPGDAEATEDDPVLNGLEVRVERKMKAAPGALYRAWTEQFDAWFAEPGQTRMRAEIGEPFYFETQHDGAHHPHYGRFLALEPDLLVTLTWITGEHGTRGAETVVTVELSPLGEGTTLSLTQKGFYDEPSGRQHDEAWPTVLQHLDEVLIGNR